MVQTVAATFDNGVFIPDEKLNLAEHTRVRLLVEPLEGGSEAARRDSAWAALEDAWQQTTLDSKGDRLTREQLHERR
jgi:predicted DNA-binding antitoxin AbrB/MazE fold protein